MTDCVFLREPTRATVSATVVKATAAGVELDRTVFYARGGGQLGDTGVLRWSGGEIGVVDTVKGEEAGTILHVPAEGSILPPPGAEIEAAIDWSRRERMMRMHTSLHLLCAVLPGSGVTGGQIGEARSRLDFDMSSPPPKEDIEAALNALIGADHPVGDEWVDEAVLDRDPGLVRTLSVKPPRGAGRIRLVRIGRGDAPIDLQPCGGTHVARTGMIGALRVLKIENKGRQNRRVLIALAD